MFSLYERSLRSPSLNVLKDSKDTIKFNCGDPNYNEFLKKYESDRNCFGFSGKVAKNSTGRKFKAIPNMVYGLIKAIGHLFLTLVCGVSLKPAPAKACIFAIGRDFEEIYGNFIAIFNDRLGLYHIQQAEFQKKCYCCFLEKNS